MIPRPALLTYVSAGGPGRVVVGGVPTDEEELTDVEQMLAVRLPPVANPLHALNPALPERIPPRVTVTGFFLIPHGPGDRVELDDGRVAVLDVCPGCAGRGVVPVPEEPQDTPGA